MRSKLLQFIVVSLGIAFIMFYASVAFDETLETNEKLFWSGLLALSQTATIGTIIANWDKTT